MSRRLADAFPEIRKRVEHLLLCNPPTAAHLVFGRAFSPLLIESLAERRGEILGRIFDFLEELATDADGRVQEVVVFSVCENLGKDPEVLTRAQAFMRPKTLQMCREVEEFWAQKWPDL